MVSALARKHVLSIQPPDGSSTADWKDATFLIHSLKLNSLLGDIINEFYSESPIAGDDQTGLRADGNVKNVRAPSVIHRIEAGDFADLVKFEAALREWETSLPSELKLPSTDDLMQAERNEQLKMLDRHALVLRLR